MSILSRFADIISANVNALLEKAEDPAKMVDQYLIKAKEDLAQVKQETAGVMAEETRCKRLMDDAQEAVDKYDALAKKALLAGSMEQLRLPAEGSFTDDGAKLNVTSYPANHEAFMRFVYDS